MTKKTNLPNGFKPCECGRCDKIIPIYDKQNRFRRFVNGHNISKGNRRKMKDGYIGLWKPDYFSATRIGYVLEHIYVFQEYHKCCVLKWAEIHHINQIKTDNRIENLQCMLKSKHRSLHHKGKKLVDMSNRYCLICRSSNTVPNKNGCPNWYNYNGGFICKKCNSSLYYYSKTKGLQMEDLKKTLRV